MKATLTFTLPEERSEHAIAVAAPQLHAALHDLDNYLRLRLDADLSQETVDELEAIRVRLHDEVTIDMVDEL